MRKNLWESEQIFEMGCDLLALRVHLADLAASALAAADYARDLERKLEKLEARTEPRFSPN